MEDRRRRADAAGRLSNWWTADDLKPFEPRAACVARQFDAYAIEPGVRARRSPPRMVQGDPDPTGKYRVVGPLSNLPEFARAFACAPDAPMVRPAGPRCEVW